MAEEAAAEAPVQSQIVGFMSEYVDRSEMKCLTARFLKCCDESGKIKISELITNASLGKGADSSKLTADKIYVWNGSTYVIYFLHTSGEWRKAGATAAEDETTATNDTIDFGTAFFYKKGSLTKGDYTMKGEVYDATETITVNLDRSEMKFLSYPWPVEQTLEQIGAGITNPGKGADSTKLTADKIYKWNGSTYVIYYYNTGNFWALEGTTTQVPAGTVTFGANEGFFVKKGSLTKGSITFTTPFKK